MGSGLRGGFGVVIRNHLGAVYGCFCRSHCDDTICFPSRVDCSTECGFVKVIFEGDSTMVLAAMKDQGEDCSSFGPVINDVRFFLRGLAHSRVTHIKREGNLAAHRLARMGIGSSQEFVWFEEPPVLIQLARPLFN